MATDFPSGPTLFFRFLRKLSSSWIGTRQVTWSILVQFWKALMFCSDNLKEINVCLSVRNISLALHLLWGSSVYTSHRQRPHVPVQLKLCVYSSLKAPRGGGGVDMMGWSFLSQHKVSLQFRNVCKCALWDFNCGIFIPLWVCLWREGVEWWDRGQMFSP